jgi:hypothetical protein
MIVLSFAQNHLKTTAARPTSVAAMKSAQGGNESDDIPIDCNGVLEPHKNATVHDCTRVRTLSTPNGERLRTGGGHMPQSSEQRDAIGFLYA